MAKAELIFKDRYTFEDGDIVEMKIWKVPNSVPPSDHSFKYSLFYGRQGERIVGYDNERGKGDHKHVQGTEVGYTFTTVERLVSDFLDDVRRIRNV